MTGALGTRDAALALSVRRPADFIGFPREAIDSSIVHRFERQVERYPDQVAVKVGENRCTYHAMNVAANRVAHGLLGLRGLGSEQAAVLCQRDGAMVEAVLGVLKAGKVWVPLDPSYPQVRNRYILEHSQATVLITDERNAEAARHLAAGRCPVVTVGRWPAPVLESNPGLSVPSSAVACILYTSGSSGLPKGVVHSHRNLLHLIMRYTNALGIASSDRMSLLTSCSHMAGVSTLFRGLLNGATILPLDPRQVGLAELGEWVQREAITVLHLVPTLFRHMVRGFQGGEMFPELRLVHLGGETLSRSDVDLFRRVFLPPCVLLNNLGCTEISSFRQYLIDHDTEVTSTVVPVGHAVEDTEVLLLDESGSHVPPGQPGEIVVRSPYLALGYWRDPDLTGARFSPDGEEGCRVYRTGDLGRLLPDGRLIHLGRLDSQVQIRGQRVEVGEAEQALLGSGQLQACAVVGGEDPSGDTQLIAYVVAMPGAAAAARELRALLQSKLPSYMVPAAFVWLDALPLLPNGKVDRRTLPAPDWAMPIPDAPFVAPRTPLEGTIAGIWTEVLGVARVGVHDDFFALGANSLHLTRALSRIRQSVATDISIEALFDAPTVAELALAIERGHAAAVSPSSPGHDESHP